MEPDRVAQVDDRFVRPGWGWYALFLPGIGSLVAMSVSQEAYDRARGRVPLPTRRTVQLLAAGTVALHVLEARATTRMARRRGMSRSARRWGAEALLLGFPVPLRLRSVSSP